MHPSFNADNSNTDSNKKKCNILILVLKLCIVTVLLCNEFQMFIIRLGKKFHHEQARYELLWSLARQKNQAEKSHYKHQRSHLNADFAVFFVPQIFRTIDLLRQYSLRPWSKVDDGAPHIAKTGELQCSSLAYYIVRNIFSTNSLLTILQTAMRAFRIHVRTTECVTEDSTITTVIVLLASLDRLATEV